MQSCVFSKAVFFEGCMSMLSDSYVKTTHADVNGLVDGFNKAVPTTSVDVKSLIDGVGTIVTTTDADVKGPTDGLIKTLTNTDADVMVFADGFSMELTTTDTDAERLVDRFGKTAITTDAVLKSPIDHTVTNASRLKASFERRLRARTAPDLELSVDRGVLNAVAKMAVMQIDTG